MEWTREHDAVIARELGHEYMFKLDSDYQYYRKPDRLVQDEGGWGALPAYLTAPTLDSDYEVLRWVREHPEAHPTAQGWAGAVASKLWSMWSLRAIEAGASVEPYADVPMHYQAGDYAMALYAVLREEAK